MTEARDEHKPVLRAARKPRRRDKQGAAKRDLARIVHEALSDYRARLEARGTDDILASDSVVRQLPRIEKLHVDLGPAAVPRMRPEEVHAGVFAVLGRVFVWLRLFLMFRGGVLVDRLRGVDSVERRAARLLRLIQAAGGSLIKVGQQLAMRVDMLPYEYCRELGKLTDAVTPFSSETAIKIVERASGKPLSASFAAFDPDPIGSASIACVFQAVLHNGHKVAVKIRRPNIAHVFAADIRAMRWTLGLLEATSLLRAGNLDNFVKEFEDAIFEELDFTMEAYHQTIFRREARKAPWKGDFLTAPLVYYEYTSREVLVTEFVSGLWMWELLAAVEQREPAALARMHAMNIDPKKVAERMHFVSMWGMLVSDIYHADPHPANIVVQKDSTLVFVDFGACGSMDRVKKDQSRDIMYHQLNHDMSGMVKAMLAAMEPLPHIDVDRFEKEVELEVAKNMRKVWSKRAPWYDKTSAANWLALFSMLQKYNLPSSLDSVRAFRAQMLYDTLAVRVHPQLDTMRSIRKFFKRCEKATMARTRQALERRLERGLVTGAELQTLGDVGGLLGRGMRTLRKFIDSPKYNFVSSIEKSVFTVLETTRYIVGLALVLGLACLGVALARRLGGQPVDFVEIFDQVVMHEAYWLFAGLFTLISVRRLRFRLRDHDHD